MFKLIKLDFYDEFACMMSKCPDNCCDEEWDIYIDDDTLRLYEQAKIPDLFSRITCTKPHKIIKHDHKCPFITSGGLCTLHRDYGEEYLSNTCRSYPRFVSEYGDVYLETLGMSCPAAVSLLLQQERPVCFPDSIYYEKPEEIGTRPEITGAQRTAYDVITGFLPGVSVTETYLRQLEEGSRHTGIRAVTKKDILTIVANTTISTPSELYAGELYTEHYIKVLVDDETVVGDEGLFAVEEKLQKSNKLFSSNINRMFLFEHMMLESQKERPNKNDVLLRGLIVWLLLLMAFECMNDQNDLYNDTDIINCTYKLMRIADHGGETIEKAAENALCQNNLKKS